MMSRKFRRTESFPAVYCRVIDVLFLGSAGVGKTNLVRRLLDMEFQDKYVPTVYDVFHKEIINENGKVTFQITDMSGYYSFPPMRRIAITKSNVFVLVYEIGNEKSYKEIKRQREEIEQLKGDAPKNIIIVGNKIDKAETGMIRDVESEDELIASSYASLRLSAKSGESVILLFQSIMEAISHPNLLGVKSRNFSNRKTARSFAKRLSWKL